MDEEKNRRKNYFIKREFQTRFILKFCGLLILASVISGFILYLFSRGTATTTFVNSRLSIMSTADYILPVLIGGSLITVILVSIATVVLVKYLSHRIAGPLFKIEKGVREVGEGNLNLKVALRSTDEISKQAECVNEMTGKLKTHLLEIKARARDLGREIDSLKTHDAFKSLSEKKEKLDQAIAYFKAED